MFLFAGNAPECSAPLEVQKTRATKMTNELLRRPGFPGFLFEMSIAVPEIILTDNFGAYLRHAGLGSPERGKCSFRGTRAGRFSRPLSASLSIFKLRYNRLRGRLHLRFSCLQHTVQAKSGLQPEARPGQAVLDSRDQIMGTGHIRTLSRRLYRCQIG